MNIKENYKNTEHKQRKEKQRDKKQSKICLILGVDKKVLREKKEKKNTMLLEGFVNIEEK